MGLIKRAIKKVFSYFKEVGEETRKVTWPNQKTTTRYSIAVVIVALSVAAMFAVLDAVFNLGLEELLKISG